ESMIEMHSLRPLARRLRPSIAAGSYRPEPRQRIHRPVCAQGPLTIAVAMPHHVQVLRRFRDHVEITEHNEIPGKRRIGKAETSTAGQRAAFRLEIHRTILEEADLPDALVRRDMVEMDRIDAQRTTRRIDHHLDGAPLQVEP